MLEEARCTVYPQRNWPTESLVLYSLRKAQPCACFHCKTFSLLFSESLLCFLASLLRKSSNNNQSRHRSSSVTRVVCLWGCLDEKEKTRFSRCGGHEKAVPTQLDAPTFIALSLMSLSMSIPLLPRYVGHVPESLLPIHMSALTRWDIRAVHHLVQWTKETF